MKNILFADFETTVNDNPVVYSWGVYSNTIWKYGIDISSFLSYCLSLKEDTIIYFANGSKFDFHYILPALKGAGLKPKKTTEYTVDANEFDTMINGQKHILELKIGLKSKSRKGKVQTVIFRDIFRLFPGSIASYAKTIGMEKIKLDGGYLKTTQYLTVSELENDGNQLEYLKNDCVVGYKFAELMMSKLPFNDWKITSAATAYHLWQKSLRDKLLNHYIKNELVETQKTSHSSEHNPFIRCRFKGNKKWVSTKKMGNELIDELLPTYWLNKKYSDGEREFTKMYEWYNGGLTIANPLYQGIIFKDKLKINMYDINSSYPSVMISEKIPYGVPIKKYHPDYPLHLYKVIIEKETVNNNGLPFVPYKTGTRNEYRKILPKGMIIYLTSPEYERFEKYYTGKWTKQLKYAFKAIDGKFIFGDYINKYFDYKNNAKKIGDAVLEMLAKILLNALYGKFGTKEEMETYSWDFENNFIGNLITEIKNSKFYLPVAIFTTAYARMKLVDSVGELYKYFLYGDTDSKMIRADKEYLFKFDKDNEKIGSWKLEKKEYEGVIRRAKQYLIKKEEQLCVNNACCKKRIYIKSAFAGIRFKGRYPNYFDFLHGAWITEQLRPKRLPTGILLEEHDKEIKPIFEYESHPESWYKNADEYFDNYDNHIDYLNNL